MWWTREVFAVRLSKFLVFFLCTTLTTISHQPAYYTTIACLHYLQSLCITFGTTIVDFEIPGLDVHQATSVGKLCHYKLGHSTWALCISGVLLDFDLVSKTNSKQLKTKLKPDLYTPCPHSDRVRSGIVYLLAQVRYEIISIFSGA